MIDCTDTLEPLTKPVGRFRDVRLAVLVPCHNEALSIAQVIKDFRRSLPEAEIFVYDNCSSDGTAEVARRAGATVRSEPVPGKGNVVRRMFSDVDADVYLLVDGDATYDAYAAPAMVNKLLEEGVDMVVGARQDIFAEAHRRGHGLGNRLFNALFHRCFGRRFVDIFSGYRVFSRRFVKTFPAISSGFEIETEMSFHAVQLRLPVAEMSTAYGKRIEGSASKLRTFHDAFRILRTFVRLLKEGRPAMFFLSIASAFALAALVLGYPLLLTFLDTGLVPRLPTAVLATGLMILAGMSMMCGLILDNVTRGQLEQKRIAYLRIPRTEWPG
ncbi:MAG: glycosyltransferase family 2 protein [Burkholderiaceae bacterium]